MTLTKELYVEHINGIDMNSLILLNKDQIINVPLSFNTITVENDIPVGNFVNGYYLEQEFTNTVMVRITNPSLPCVSI